MTDSPSNLETDKNSYRWYLCYRKEYNNEMIMNLHLNQGNNLSWICGRTDANYALNPNTLPIGSPTMAIPIYKQYPEFLDKIIILDIIRKSTDVLFMKYPLYDKNK